MNATSMINDQPSSDTLDSLQDEHHAQCVLCGKANEQGLGLDFTLGPDGEVEAPFSCPDVLRGYPEMLHGGVISSLLDSAMTNCLFAHGQVGVTAKLNVVFRHPVRTDELATVRAWPTDGNLTGPVFQLQAQLKQADQLVATATGVFILKAWAKN